MKTFVVSLECELTVIDGENLNTIGFLKDIGAEDIQLIDRGKDYKVYAFLVKQVPFEALTELSRNYRDLILQIVYYEADKAVKLIFENGISFEWAES